jgi:hypothetical protein
VIVYGDPAFTVSPREVGKAFEAGGPTPTIDQLRDLLIAAGQVEQAIADSGEDDRAACTVTDNIATAFVARLQREGFIGANVAEFALESNPVGPPLSPPRGEGQGEGCSNAHGPPLSSAALRIKAPEGYAFYTVFPEQHLQAAQAWLNLRDGVGRVFVVGIRSIGTSLSAIVTAALRSAKIDAQRITVRPTGDPFQRVVALDSSSKGFQHALVVDEGPGLSGSSIAAAVSALRAQGLSDVTVFPSHANAPGHAASESVRRIWEMTPKIVFPALGQSFRESWLYEPLKRKTEEILQSPVIASDDLSAGNWRNVVQGGQVSAVPAFERAKFRFRAANGRALLWKFAGLGYGPGFVRLSEQAFLRQRRAAKIGWSSPSVATEHGFMATEWIDAPLATPADLTAKTARHIARYLLDAGKLPRPDEAQQNLDRLKRMAFCNVQEGLGAEWAGRVMRLADRVKASEEMPCYGDGRLGPHEWLRSGDRLTKTDVWGHDFDHTCIGTQSLLWDIAGALLEWQMTGAEASAFCKELHTAGLLWRDEELAFYKAAYRAFRLGVATMFGDESEAEQQSAALRAELGATS